MASIPGTHYDVFSGNQTVNFGVTADPNTIPAPVPSDLNVELLISSSIGTGAIIGYIKNSAPNIPALTTPFAPLGYQGVAVLSALSPDLGALAVIHGDYAVLDNGGADMISLGDGNETVVGSFGDTLIGGSAANQLLDGHLGNQLLLGGSSGNETIRGGTGDTIVGGAGNEFIDGSQGGQSICGGNAANETIWSGTADTVRGGAAGDETIAGAMSDTITGGGANIFVDASAGNELIAAGSGNSTIWGGAGDTVQGAMGNGTATIDLGADNLGRRTLWDDWNTSGHDTVYNFNTDRDVVSISRKEDLSAVQASAHILHGGVQFNLADGSTITLIGVTNFTNIAFTSR